MAQKLIIDTDPGVDDAMAIHLAFADPRLEVIGLTTIFGNVTTRQATRNALYLAEMAQYRTVIAEGSSVPRRRTPQPPAHFVHGSEGFGTLPAVTPKTSADPRDAARFLCESCAAAPDEIVICAVGPLTNLAAALDHDPAIVDHVKHVVIMGGSAARHGNVSDCAEANIWNDPDAADAVFAADWNLTMIGLDVTEKTQCTPDDFTTIAKTSPHIGGFLEEVAEFYFDFHENKTGKRICFMHDPSAIIAITNPELFGYEMAPITVTCDGDEIGRTVAMPNTPKNNDGRRDVQIATDVNTTAVRQMFMSILATADKKIGQRG